jgi:CRISPR-associated protein Cas2
MKMPMIVIDLLGASNLIEGQVSRKLIEVRPGVYAGSLSKRQTEILWDAVIKSKPKAALIIYSAKTEIGISMKSFGDHRYQIVDQEGVQLVAYQKKNSRHLS